PLLFETTDVPKKPTTVVVDVDLVGVIYSVNLALHYFRKNGGKGGRIIITSSQVGIHPFPTGPIYGAAKAGVSLLHCTWLVRLDTWTILTTPTSASILSVQWPSG